ncbi:hypothetical protein [Rhizobium sp. MHM7A]|uniref:hypothetical protein n=1 Tax=Rhizobium sp. MHM7A TaxID=2583233 RepID=UPI0011072C7D|nr:hypothetical protein [Rhizobium sp. MHM7A]TLX16063.1 hypothetical protein FFR93_01715 [Rhizobium sp. MHM7A]
MRKFIVVENEEDKAHFVAAGLDSLATVYVSGRNSALSLTSSFAMTDKTYAVYVIGTASEEDRFFSDWLVDAEYLASRSINDSQGSILPAAPSIEAACRNDAWVNRLKQRLDGHRKS